MGQNAHTGRSRRGYITIDWMVLVVGCIAVLFLMGTMLRTSGDADAFDHDGFFLLTGDDALLAYQDFSFEAAGWSPAGTSDTLPGLGPVLGPFGTQAVQRSFAMPATATEARVSFDLHLIGPWTDGDSFLLALGDTEVLTIGLPGDADPSALDLQQADVPGVAVAVQSNTVHPRPAEPALPGSAEAAFVTLRIGMAIMQPDETLTLRLQAAGAGQGDARWTLDNVTVVATTGDRARQN